jgi:hypothetical protein
MKRTSVLLVVVVVFILFAAARAGAVCDPTLPTGWCFDGKNRSGGDGGYMVQIANIDGSPILAGGTFPVIDGNNNSVFTYLITKTTAKRHLQHADILIPVCLESLFNPLPNPICQIPPGTPSSCVGKFFTLGSGEPDTGFGLGVTTDDTWKWKWEWPDAGRVGTASLTLKGILHAVPNAMLLKKDDGGVVYGQILAPSCGSSPRQVFAPEVPLTTMKEEQIDFGFGELACSSSGKLCTTTSLVCSPSGTPCTLPGYFDPTCQTEQPGSQCVPNDLSVCQTGEACLSTRLVCIESKNDPSGCPTNVFTCPNFTTCSCPGSQIPWTKESLSEIVVPAGHLKQLWTNADPPCPTTYVTTESSTCVRRCNNYTGYCYVGPPGCNPGTSVASPQNAMLSMVSNALISTTPYGGSIPVTAFKQETVNGVNICSETINAFDQCPTFYSCTDNTCNCDPTTNAWPLETSGKFAIDKGHLKWVGASGDPNCPTVDIVTQSSTCVKRCNPYTGSCYVGPPGCT